MPNFRILRVFNDPSLRGYANAKSKVGRNTLPHFPSDTLVDRLLRELAKDRALALKEITEAFEFFAVVRRYLGRRSTLADLCCGHGLAGLLFAIFEPKLEQVLLLDRRKPESFGPLLGACLRVAPWIEHKLQFVEGPLEQSRQALPADCAVISVHACGSLTDTCIAIGVAAGGPLAVMPCCRSHQHNPAPDGLRQALGEDLAYDVDRTYALERLGYQVRWREIPEAITPMNRVLIAVPRKLRVSQSVAP